MTQRPPERLFADRESAGRLLAAELRGESDCVVLGVVRGGVLVAKPIAAELRAPLDIVVIRKVGHPMQPELAIGAVSAEGDCVFTDYAVTFAEADLREWVDAAQQRARELEARLRGDNRALPLAEKTAIVVDDGIATSATIVCAAATARRRGAARIVGAVPIAPADVAAAVRPPFDDFLVLQSVSHPHFAVGRFYVNFHEVSDDEVRAVL